ncbi:MAG: DUF4145 domain-containing protein [Deltaproteobacteria bacterium]|nr:DUF4145 domain-containing protein [Deltaproteobacteria bacterium]
MKTPDMTRRFICRICQRETGHWPIANGQVKGSEKKLKRGESSFKTFQVVQCKDCGTTTYCIDTKIHPGSMIGDSYTKNTEYFPPIPLRIKPEWYSYLTENYQAILDEVYVALDNSLSFLSSTGARTALDQLIIEKIGDIGDFKTKVKKMVANKIIDETESAMLLAVIDAGSASAHRSYRPDNERINHMMDILEAIFYKLVVEPEKRKS